VTIQYVSFKEHNNMKKNGKKVPGKERSKKKTDQEISGLEDLLETIPEDARDELIRLAEESDSEDEFVRAVFVGDCPRCESDQTGMPEGPGDDEDMTVGLCKACGYVWCLECDHELAPGASCGHWQICESCEQLEEESGLCNTSPDQCDVIQVWLAQKRS